MAINHKRSLQDILNWVESFTGIGICVRNGEGGLVCQSPGFGQKGNAISQAGRTFRPSIGKDSPEWNIVFDPQPDGPLPGKIHDFINSSFSHRILQERSIESLSREVVDSYGEINLFYKLSETLLDITDIQKICRNILDQALERIPSHKGSILLLKPEGGHLRLAAAQGGGLEEKVGDDFFCKIKGCILETILEAKKPLFTNDLNSLSMASGHECSQLLGSHSVLAVPLPMPYEPGKGLAKEFIGMIVLSDKKANGHDFTSPDLKLLLSLASQAALSITHSKTLAKVQSSKKALEETYNELMRTYESLQKHASLNEQINQISKRIHATQNIRSIFSALADYSKNLLRAEFGLAVYKKEDESIKLHATSGFKERAKIKELSGNLRPGRFRNILETGKSLSFCEARDGSLDLGLGLEETPIKSFLGIPIFYHGAPRGVIAVFNSEGTEGFSGDDLELLNSLALQASTVLENAALINKLKVAQHTTMIKLAELAEKRDPETGLHLDRMKHYSRTLALTLRENPKYRDILTEDFVESIFQSSPLHDIGKVGIHDSVLLKPGKLTDEEFEVMKTHAQIGGEILDGPDFLKIGRNMALCHHEKFDGSGYPRGLKGDEIPIEARILSLADVFDALTSRRVYKEPFPFDKAYSIITHEKGRAFDPDVVEAFNNCLEKCKEIQEKYGD